MIERHWKGVAKSERAKEYVAHLQNDTFRQLVTITGFISARILERNTRDGIEFLIVTEWTDEEAVRQFAGSNIETAVVPEAVRELMVTYDRTVRHYKITFETSE